MGFLAPIVAVASGIAGIASTVKSLTQKPAKAPKPEPLPKAPTAQDAAAKAQEEAKKRQRRMTQTDITKGSALVPNVNIANKSLLGTSNAY